MGSEVQVEQRAGRRSDAYPDEHESDLTECETAFLGEYDRQCFEDWYEKKMFKLYRLIWSSE